MGRDVEVAQDKMDFRGRGGSKEAERLAQGLPDRGIVQRDVAGDRGGRGGKSERLAEQDDGTILPSDAATIAPIGDQKHGIA